MIHELFPLYFVVVQVAKESEGQSSTGTWSSEQLSCIHLFLADLKQRRIFLVSGIFLIWNNAIKEDVNRLLFVS